MLAASISNSMVLTAADRQLTGTGEKDLANAALILASAIIADEFPAAIVQAKRPQCWGI
jgi:hypothetical protein